MRVKQRDELSSYLQENKIPHGVYYPVPLHLQKAYAQYGYFEGEFPVSEAMSKEVISLPMHADLLVEQIEYIADKIKEFYK